MTPNPYLLHMPSSTWVADLPADYTINDMYYIDRLLIFDHVYLQPSPLFQKIEPATIQALKDRFVGQQVIQYSKTCDEGTLKCRNWDV